jgi:hypothetical protein
MLNRRRTVGGVHIEEVVEQRTEEDRNERRARELTELLQELRVRVMFVITDFLFGSVAAALATAAVSGFFLYVWFLMPIRYRLNAN